MLILGEQTFNFGHHKNRNVDIEGVNATVISKGSRVS